MDVKEHQQRSSADFIRWLNLAFTGSLVGTPPTVDGRDPKQPPGMYKTLKINGICTIYELVQDFFHQQYKWTISFPKVQ